MKWRFKAFQALSTQELYQLLALRCEVFIVEQNCPYQDVDGKDAKAVHLLGYENEKLVAYCRIFKPGDYFEDASIGRVIVKPEARGKQAGYALMKEAMQWIAQNWGAQPIDISAQMYLLQFYTNLGFVAYGEPYLEDDIPHTRMRYVPV